MSSTPPTLPTPTPFPLTLPVATTTQDGTVAAPPPPGGSPDGAGGGSPGSGGGLMAWLPFIAIGAVFWMLIIGPERKNRKKREQMLAALKKGDKVMTTGGLYGRVTEVRDDVVMLDTGDVRLKFARSAVQGIVGDSEK